MSKRNYYKGKLRRENEEIKTNEEATKRGLLVYYSKIEFLRFHMLSNSPGFQIKGNQDNNNESKDKRHRRKEVEYTKDGYLATSDVVD